MMKKLKKVLNDLMQHPMAKGKFGGGVLWRFFSWQLVKKHLYQKGMLWNWIGDRKLWIYPSRTAVTGNYYEGLLEYEEMSFLLHYARKEDIFIDCGANVGVYSVLLGKICKKGYAIEPSKDTYKLLKQNIKTNNIDCVELIKKGIGNKTGSFFFTKGMDTVNHVILESDIKNFNKYEKINIITLDEMIKNDESITILKIDVEGMEKEVLEGAKNLLKSKSLNIVIMETFRDEELINMLLTEGFSLYSYDPSKRKLKLAQYNKNKLNGIFIRNIKKAKIRVKNGDEFKIYGRRF